VTERHLMPFDQLDHWVVSAQLQCQDGIPKVVPVNDQTGAAENASKLRNGQRRSGGRILTKKQKGIVSVPGSSTRKQKEHSRVWWAARSG
jgi:hypothetical protein